MKDGGSAYPYFASMRQGTDYDVSETGMTLRDYFAGQAVIALMAGQPVDWKKMNLSHVAQVSFQIADAMLSEREK